LCIQKQFEEEQQTKIAKESLEATIGDAGTLGETDIQSTAHGEAQQSSVNNMQQESGNFTANATGLPDDAANSTSTLISCTAGREAVGQPVEASLCLFYYLRYDNF
jgi:hypothetical protein